MANPIRLFRNTPYDLRQIVAWMDQCLLIATLPDYAEALRKAGITGATALAGLWKLDPGKWREWKETSGKWVELPGKKQEDIEKLAKDLKPLADRIGMSSPDLLRDVIERLDADAQQNRIRFWRQWKETDV